MTEKWVVFEYIIDGERKRHIVPLSSLECDSGYGLYGYGLYDWSGGREVLAYLEKAECVLDIKIIEATYDEVGEMMTR